MKLPFSKGNSPADDRDLDMLGAEGESGPAAPEDTSVLPDLPPPPPLTADLTKSIRFSVSQPQGYYFGQVEVFVEQVVDTLRYYEEVEFRYRRALYEAQVELDQQTYDVQRLRSEIEVFRVQGSPMVHPDGSYVTESEQAAQQEILDRLAHRESEVARLTDLAAQQEAEIASLREWGEQVVAELQETRAALAAAHDASPVETHLPSEPVAHIEAEPVEVLEPVYVPVEDEVPEPLYVPVEDETPEFDPVAALDIPESVEVPEPVYVPIEDEPVDTPGPVAPDLSEVPEVPGLDTADFDEDQLLAHDASSDDTDPTPNHTDHEPSEDDPEGGSSSEYDPYEEYDREMAAEAGESVPVIPVDSELPEGVQLPGTGEAAITYPPAAPGAPINTHGVHQDVWAPELDPRVQDAIEEERKHASQSRARTQGQAQPDEG